MLQISIYPFHHNLIKVYMFLHFLSAQNSFNLPSNSCLIHSTFSIILCLHVRHWEIFSSPCCSLWSPCIIVSFSCQHDTDLESNRKRESQLKNCLDHTGLLSYLWGIILIANWYRRSQSSKRSTILRQVGLGCTRKLDDLTK